MFSFIYSATTVCSRSICFIPKVAISDNFMFDHQSGVRLVRGVVKDVQPQKIILNDGTEVPYGLLVWSTGVGPSPFVHSLPFPKSPGGRYFLMHFAQPIYFEHNS